MSLVRLQHKFEQGEKLACMTAYDASFARVMDQVGMDLILVGDSLGMVLKGQKDTLGVSMQDMLYHTASVRQGISQATLMADMPFLSYTSAELAVMNAGRLLVEGGADIVKIEGGEAVAPVIQEVVKQFIPVCGHIGLKPQQVRQLGGFVRQGKENYQKQQIIEDAIALQEAGVSVLLLECVHQGVAESVMEQTDLPLIGIGVGTATCSGQILVCYDVLGISKMQPWFSKDFLANSNSIQTAFAEYVREVKVGAFPPRHL